MLYYAVTLPQIGINHSKIEQSVYVLIYSGISVCDNCFLSRNSCQGLILNTQLLPNFLK